MAVYKQNYKRYDGPITDERSRFTVLPRFSFQSVFETRAFTVFYMGCFVPVAAALVIQYLLANLDAVRAVTGGPAPNLNQLIQVDTRFFTYFMHCQQFLTFILAMFVGPGLVSPDLTNGALPMYLSRPFSRQEYVVGKMCVVVTLASLITWIPGLLIFAIQSNLEAGWMASHLRIAVAVFVGSWLWILVVALLSLAISAWVKWRPVAAAVMFGVFFVAAVFGETANGILNLDKSWGLLMDITEVMNMLWSWLFDAVDTYRGLPVWTALISIAVFCAASLFMLWKKIRACEVIR